MRTLPVYICRSESAPNDLVHPRSSQLLGGRHGFGMKITKYGVHQDSDFQLGHLEVRHLASAKLHAVTR